MTLDGGLEALDQSNADVDTLINRAANIVGLDLSQTGPDFTVSAERKVRAADPSFREQWVLKWLTRKIHAEAQAVSKENRVAPSRTPLLKSHLWSLLLHVLCSISDQACAEILVERKFVQCLDQATQFLLRQAPQNLDVRTKGPTPAASRYGEDGTSVKRRRLSPEPQVIVDGGKEAEQAHHVLTKVLQVCCRIAAIFGQGLEDGVESSSKTITAWSSVPKDNASMLATGFCLVLAICTEYEKQPANLGTLDQVTQLLSFWHTRPTAVSESDRKEEVSSFSAYCLAPCLQLLHLARVGTAIDETHEPRKALETLVAVNTVLPLRKKFFERHAKSWRSQTQHISWREIQKVYNGLIRVIDPSSTSLSSHDVTMRTFSWAHHVSIIYSISIRILPNDDLQRRQQEQPWLDALLLFLSYVSCPRLIKIEITKGENVEVLDPAYSSELTDIPAALEPLLEAAIKQRYRPSLQALGYLTSAIVSWETIDRPWSLMGKVIELDTDVLVSNSGLVTSTYALNVLLERVEVATVSRDDYTILLSQVVVPLLSGYGRSRALKAFMERWSRYLQEALRKRDISVAVEDEVPTVLVWQDEDLFERFSEVYRLHGTAALTQDILSRLCDDLNGLSGRIGSTLDVFAQAAIAIPIIEALSVTDNTVEPIVFSNIQAYAIAGLDKRSDYQGQRWILWKLVRAIHDNDLRIKLSPRVLEIERPNTVSLKAVAVSTKKNSSSEISSAVYRECLERFALIVAGAASRSQCFEEAFHKDVESLMTLMPSSMSGTLSASIDIWDGRLSDLDQPPKLASACLGIIFARPEVLKLVPDFVQGLSCMFREHDSDSALSQRLSKAIVEVDDLNASQDGVVEGWMATKGVASISVPQLQQLWRDASTGRFIRLRARAMGEMMFQLLKAFSGRIQMESLVYLLTTIDYLSSRVSMSYTRAEAWEDWMGVLDVLELKHQGGFTRLHLQAAGSIKRILSRTWAHCLEAQSLRRTLENMSSRNRSHSTEWQLPRPLSPFIAFQIAVPNIIAENTSTRETEYLVRQYINKTQKNLTQLTVDPRQNNALTEDWLVQTSGPLEALLEICPLLPTNETKSMQKEAISLKAHFSSCDSEASTSDMLASVQRQCNQLCVAAGVEGNSKSLDKELSGLALALEPKTYEDLSRLASKAQSLVGSLDKVGRVDLLNMVLQDPWRTDLGVLQPILRAAVILQTSADVLAESPSQIECLNKVASLQSAGSIASAAQLALDLESSKLVLEQLPEVVNQNTLDTLLASLCRILSKFERLKDEIGISSTPDAIYKRICRLLGTIMSRFRRRLADRHHLLLPVLQALLRCLFFPGKSTLESRQGTSRSYSGTFFDSLPAWLKESEQILPPSAASTLSRLLSTICNPTVSAAKSSRRHIHNALNDETQRVKALAGQHMQYLVMEYARCSLDGDIKSEVKDKLLPGMYTVLDAMSRDVMRGMNAAMDPSSRAIFKTLYDDWTRYGRWNKN